MPNINNISPSWIIKKKSNNSSGWTSTGNKAYHTQRWKRLSKMVLNRDPICKICNDKPSVLSDHIEPVTQGGDMYDMNNLQGLCVKCHNKKSAKEGAARRKGGAV